MDNGCIILKSIIFAEISLKFSIFDGFLVFFSTFKTTTGMSEIAEKVKGIIVDKLGVEGTEVTDEASFANDLGADSLDTVELIMEFEKEFNLSIPDEAAEKIVTVGDAITYLQENKK